MISVSLLGIKIHATHGLYEQEHLLGHQFEVDVWLHAEADASSTLPYMDYGIINRCVQAVFTEKEKLLESLVKGIYEKLAVAFPQAQRIKVCVRKMHPPLGASVSAAEVCFEQ